MAKIVKGARFISKLSDSTLTKPTIPIKSAKTDPTDHTSGWKSTDIYIGEWYFNTVDSKAYFRADDGIYEMISVKIANADNTQASNSKIKAEYLPGNYVGAMVFKGLWDASKKSIDYPNGIPPGVDIIPNYQPANGDYFVVSVTGTTPLFTITGVINDWVAGDFAVYTESGIGWEKIDNTEQLTYADMVIYKNNYGTNVNFFPTLGNSQSIFDDIYLNLYKVPVFNELSTFNRGIKINDYNDNNSDILLTINANNVSKQIINITGNPDSKWITYNKTLKIGSYGDEENSILEIGPYPILNVSLTSTTNFTYSDTLNHSYSRWSIYSTTSKGNIVGYANDGMTQNISLSPVDASFINGGGLSIGSDTLMSDTVLQVNSNNSMITPKLTISRTNMILSSGSEIGALSFYNTPTTSSFKEYAKILVSSPDSTKTHSKIGFSVMLNSGVLTEGFTIYGNPTSSAFIGINKITPTVALDVVGDALITGNFRATSASGNHIFDGDILMNNNITLSGILNFTKNSTSDYLMKLNTSLGVALGLFWDFGAKTLSLRNSTLSDSVVFNSTNGVTTFNNDITLSGSAKINNAHFSTFLVDSIATYNPSVVYASFNANNQIVNKDYVDNQINLHGGGFWIPGTTQDANNADAVLYNNTKTYWLGVNTIDPIYNLDVNGNVRLSKSGASSLVVDNIVEVFNTAGSTLRLNNSNDNMLSNDMIGNIEFYNSLNSNVSSFIKTIGRTTSGEGAMIFGISKTDKTDAIEAMRLDEKGHLCINSTQSTTHSLFVSGTTYLNSTLFVNGISNFYGDTKITKFRPILSIIGQTDDVETINFVDDNIIVSSIVSDSDRGNFNISSVHEIDIYKNSKLKIAIDETNVQISNSDLYVQTRIGINNAPDALYRLKITGDSWMTGILTVTNSVKAGIYYSNDLNTAYFLNPSTTSTSLSVAGLIKTNSNVYVGNSIVVGDILGTTTSYAGGISAIGRSYFKSNIGIGTTPALPGGDRLIVSGVTSLFGNLGVNRSADLSYNLSVNGTSQFIGKSFFSDNIGIGIVPDLIHHLLVNGKSSFSDSIGIGITANSAYKLYVSGASCLTGNLGIGVAPDSTHNLLVNGVSSFSNSVGIGIAASSTSKLSVSGYSTLFGNVGINQNPDTIHALSVTGTSTFSNNVGIGIAADSTHNLLVNGTSLFNSSVAVGTSLSVGTTLSVGTSLSVGTTLSVSGKSTFGDTISCKEGVSTTTSYGNAYLPGIKAFFKMASTGLTLHQYELYVGGYNINRAVNPSPYNDKDVNVTFSTPLSTSTYEVFSSMEWNGAGGASAEAFAYHIKITSRSASGFSFVLISLDGNYIALGTTYININFLVIGL